MKNNYCILIHYHEVGLKGKNRHWFEKIFNRNIKKHLSKLPFASIKTIGARVIISGIEETKWDLYKTKIKSVMGLSNATLCLRVKPTLDNLNQASEVLISNRLFDTFKVSARRQYKDFPLSSMEINQEVGSYIQNLTQKKVKLTNPDLICHIEIVNNLGYVGIDRIIGFGGLPLGSSELAISLISSGIDSPVASFELLKRGVFIHYVHFHSVPSTSQQSIENVKSILNVLSKYQIQCPLYLVPLLKIQQEIMKNVPNKYWVLLFRRAMIYLACKIGEKINASALITGESVGQVASQTLSNIKVVSENSSLPILRPLSGTNKQDIIIRAQQIGTFNLSIEPYEDCCSFFVPVHPATKAKIEYIHKIESKLDLEKLYNDTLNKTKYNIIS